MFFGIKVDFRAGSAAKRAKKDDVCMDWMDDEAYAYSFEEDDEDRGLTIPPRPDCLRGYEPENEVEPFYDDRPHTATAAQGKGKTVRGVDPGRIKQLKVLYQSVVRLNHERNESSFIQEAKKLSGYTVEKARHVPFRSYWPTYESMSKKQQDWYFYLRSQLRQGIYPQTDLSYLFVYIYELINQVGIEDTTDGLVQLCSLWNAYRGTYSILDKYLVLWVQDYILIYAGGDFTSMMAQIPDKSLLSLFPDSLAGCFMENPEAGFTLEFISRFSDYRFYTGQLAKSDQGGLFLSILPKVFQHINQHLFREQGKGIFGVYRPTHSTGKRRIAFQNAIYSGAVTSVCQDELPYSTYPPLRSFFTSVVKETENRLREQVHMKGRLRGFELDPKIVSAIQSLILNQLCHAVPETDRKQIQMDRDKIVQLIEESNLIRQKLLEGIEEITRSTSSERGISLSGGLTPDHDSHKADGGAMGLAGCEPAADEGSDTGEPFPVTDNTGQVSLFGENPSNTPSIGIIGAGPDFSSASEEKKAESVVIDVKPGESSPSGLLKQSLTEEQTSILSFILKNGGEADEGSIRHAFSQLFIDLEMDEINNRAMDALGDIILTRENGLWVIYEEYRSDLEECFI